MLRLRRVNRLCSRTISGTAYRFRHGSTLCSPTVEKILCRSPFRSGHMSAICARLTNKGKVGVQRGRKTAGCPSFLPPPRGAARSRRPQTANPLAEVQRKNSPPVRGEHANAVRVPRSAGAEKDSRPSRANTLTQFECPSQPVQRKKLPPGKGEPPARFGHTAKALPANPCPRVRS